MHHFEEKVGDQAIGVRWKLVVFDAEGVDIPFFDLIAAYNRHPKAFPEFLSKGGFPRSLPARDDDALWFSVHICGCPTIEFTEPQTANM